MGKTKFLKAMVPGIRMVLEREPFRSSIAAGLNTEVAPRTPFNPPEKKTPVVETVVKIPKAKMPLQ